MGDAGRHFEHREFACKCGCGYGQVHPRLVTVLEAIRAQARGKPVRIVSGVRCPVRNREVGGTVRSRHQSGEAADIPPGLVKQAAAIKAGATGIGIRGEWVVHVDVRRAARPVIWHY